MSGKRRRYDHASVPTLTVETAVISSLLLPETIKMTESSRAFVTLSYFLLALPSIFAKLPPVSPLNSTLDSNMLAHDFFSDRFFPAVPSQPDYAPL